MDGRAVLRDLESRIQLLEQRGHTRERDVVVGLPDDLRSRGVAAPRLILVSPNGTQYMLTVDDAGVLSTTAV